MNDGSGRVTHERRPQPGAAWGPGCVPEVSPPPWLHHLARRMSAVNAGDFHAYPPPARGGRASAVLLLFGPDESGEESVLLTERAHGLRSHAGQVAFPGGRVDREDDGPVAAALREAREEVGLDDRGVHVVTTSPELFVPVSDSIVTGVIGWAPRPAPVWVRSRREVDSVARVRLDDLLDPQVRFTATHPSGYRGPAFELPDLYIWGFTAGLLASVFDLAGLERPWDRTRTRPLPARFGRPRTSDESWNARARRVDYRPRRTDGSR